MALHVIGSIGFDSVVTPSSRENMLLGGSALYFAAAARFFSPVEVHGVVGHDFGDEHISHLRDLKIGSGGIQRRTKFPSFRWTVEYLGDLAQRRTLHLDSRVLSEPLTISLGSFGDSSCMFLATMDPSAHLRILDLESCPRNVFVGTIDYWLETCPDLICQLLKRVDGFVLNAAEARLFTNQSDLNEASQRLLEFGPQVVVITMDKQGCLVNHAGSIERLPAYAVQTVIDPTGAGDALAGALLGYITAAGLLDRSTIRRGVEYGVVVASFQIEDFGFRRLASISREDVERRLIEYQNEMAGNKVSGTIPQTGNRAIGAPE